MRSKRLSGFGPESFCALQRSSDKTVNANPFAKRDGINPGLLLVSFLADAADKT